ncbi:MAG: 2-oxo acid dehydrogenase subunit E2 [Vitreoscilla sp.]|nr:2-oxo acid dehydrogenase subunit E2 [Burkholderiales bacterium]MBP6338385.1 2-oxo acid dehydrogenase subunit E2 [Vitreoscilla sp.]MBP6674330.1 2-oxo acid dehydrogenase subunit E2 [Vitreoscilla sp.]
MTLHTIPMPDLGEGIAEVELVKWQVQPGDVVAEDQILCDVMTDKAAVEIPSSVAGRVVALGGEIGQMLAVGAVLIRIEGEAAEAAPVPASAPSPQTAATPQSPAPVPEAAVPPPPPHPRAAASARALAAPAVRARAVALGLDLAALRGSGPDGRILHADLDALQPTIAPTGAATDATHEVKLIGLRRKIAQKMQESKRHIPHFTYVEEVDVTELVALRDELNRQHAAARGELSPLVFIVRAMVLAVADFPQVNARFDDEAGVLTLHDAVHLGVATQTEAGLMVPVLRQAQTLGLWACTAAITRLAASARAGKATREELSGSTITVTSLGKLGGIVSTPVINHPEVAIIGVNRIVARPVVLNDTVQVRQMMNLSSSFDHRVVDGAVAAAYVQRVRQLLEHPALLFLD